MARKELRHDMHAVPLLTDHKVITPEYRGTIPIENTIALAAEGTIRTNCKEMKIEIIDKALECGSCSSVYRITSEALLPGFIAKKIKGRSSRILRQNFLHLKEWCNDHLRAPGCYHGSVGMYGWLWRDTSEHRIMRERENRNAQAWYLSAEYSDFLGGENGFR